MKNDQEDQKRYLSQADRLEESVNPGIIRTTMTMVSAAILTFILWAGFTNINEIAHTPGEIIPQGYQQIVQHLEGGMVEAIHVEEGATVKKGQLLLTLNGAGSQDDLNRALSRQVSFHLQEERLRSFTQGRSPDFSVYQESHPKLVADQQSFYEGMVRARSEERKVIEEQIVQKRRAIATLQGELATAQGNYEITKDLYDRRENLNKKGYVSDVQYLETKQRLNDISGVMTQAKNRISVTRAEIGEFENRLKSLDAQQIDEAHERLDQLIAESAENAELIEKLSAKVHRLDIRSPVDGLVQALSVNTIGAVVQPGQVLMEVVPLDKPLVVEVKIPPRHIGHLKPGQPVQVKFSSFDFSRYGFVKGRLDQISATTFTGEQGERYYEGHVVLDKNYVGHNPDNLVMPGMTVMADIITGRKTILDYLLKPIQVAMKTSFTER